MPIRSSLAGWTLLRRQGHDADFLACAGVGHEITPEATAYAAALIALSKRHAEDARARTFVRPVANRIGAEYSVPTAEVGVLPSTVYRMTAPELVDVSATTIGFVEVVASGLNFTGCVT